MRTKTKFFKLLSSGLCVMAGLLLGTMAAPSRAGASGFAVYTHGAKELGMQNSVIAHSEGPASNYHNPALITESKGTQIEAGTTLIFPSREFKSAQTGKTERTESQVFYPSTLFLTHQLNDRLTSGLGIFSPFGLGTDWGKDWEGRYLATNSEMQTFNINPNIAWKANDKLSVAGGLDFLLLDATLEKNIYLSPLPDAEQKFDGDGDGIGYNLGLVYRPNENWSFGTSYRSEIKVDVDGNAEFKFPQNTPAPVKALLPDTGGSTEIELPAQAFLGLCYQGIDKLTLEVGGRWEGWSCYEELAFEFDEPVGPEGKKTHVFEKNWKDTWSYSIGAKYDLNDTLAILGGYRFDDNPVPDDTFEPAIPASDKHAISVGANRRFGNLVAGVSYYYEKYESRKKNNNLGASLGGTANGEYNTEAHMVSASVAYEF